MFECAFDEAGVFEQRCSVFIAMIAASGEPLAGSCRSEQEIALEPEQEFNVSL